MRTREYIAWGAVIGMVVVMFTLTAVTHGPGPDTAGEATASVLGVVVDRVVIPPDPDGRAGLPTERILRGVLTTMIVSAVGAGFLGGLIGWAIGRSRIRSRDVKSSVTADAGA
jgi:hypothetical protein